MQNIYSLKNVQHIKDILNSFYPVIVLDSSEILNQETVILLFPSAGLMNCWGEGWWREVLAGRKLHGVRKLFCWEWQNGMLIIFLNFPRGNHSWIWDIYVDFLFRLRSISTAKTWIIKQCGCSPLLEISEGTNNVHSMNTYCVQTEGKVMHEGRGRRREEMGGGNKDKVIWAQLDFSGSLHLRRERTSP